MKLIEKIDKLQIGKEYYLHYDGDKIKAQVCKIENNVIYFNNIMTLQNKGYHRRIPNTEFMDITRPIAYTYQDITERKKQPIAQVCYLAVKYTNHPSNGYCGSCDSNSYGFYNCQEIYYDDPDDMSVLLGFYIIHHGQTEPLYIYEPVRDRILEKYQKKSLQMVMDKYTVPDISYCVVGLL